MANRCLLAKHKLDDFKKWVESQGYKTQKSKNWCEVFRFKTGEKGEPMPIVFDKISQGFHYSCNESAARYVRKWLNNAKR